MWTRTSCVLPLQNCVQRLTLTQSPGYVSVALSTLQSSRSAREAVCQSISIPRIPASKLSLRMLYDFYHIETTKKPKSIHATYLLTGFRRATKPKSAVKKEKPEADQDEDTVMTSSPFDVPETEKEAPLIRSIQVVPEEKLDEMRNSFERLTSIHIYSVEPAPIIVVTPLFSLLALASMLTAALGLDTHLRLQSRNLDHVRRFRARRSRTVRHHHQPLSEGRLVHRLGLRMDVALLLTSLEMLRPWFFFCSVKPTLMFHRVVRLRYHRYALRRKRNQKVPPRIRSFRKRMRKRRRCRQPRARRRKRMI